MTAAACERLWFATTRSRMAEDRTGIGPRCCGGPQQQNAADKGSKGLHQYSNAGDHECDQREDDDKDEHYSGRPAHPTAVVPKSVP